MSSAKSVTPLAIEPFDKEWGVGVSGMTENPSPFPRINEMLRWFKERPTTADPQRMVIFTEAYKKYAADPQIIKVAKALRDVLTNVEVNIWPGELIVGEIAAPAKSAPIYPEFSINWLAYEIENDPLDQRPNDVYILSDECKQAVFDVVDSWKGQTVEEGIKSSFRDEQAKGSQMGAGVYFCDLYTYGGAGHVCADYEKLIRVGFGGLRKQIEQKLSELTVYLPEDINKRNFYEAQLYVLDGVKSYISRYGDKAKEMAAVETDAQRKKELERISSNCYNVAEGVPNDIWEAMQLWHIATNMIIIEANGHSVTYGRFDQIFGDIYKKSISEGTATRELVQELTECMFLKIHQLCKIRDRGNITVSSGTMMGGTGFDVGGVDADGNDITNDLSYIALDAHAHTRIPNPWMAVRLHKDTPWEFKVKVFNVIRIGTGEPKVFGDEMMIKSLMRYGKPIEVARNYVGVGCVEPSIPGKTYGWHDSCYFNMTKVLELTLNGGRCQQCSSSCARYDKCVGAGKQLGPNTGTLADFKSFDEVKAAFETQMKYWTDRMVSSVNTMDLVHQRLKPLPYLSLIVDDCIEKGVDVTAGGARYNHSGNQCVGLGTVSDSLATIKQIVFDEKKVTGAELLDILKNNWEGSDYLLHYVNSDKVHHFGNDDDYADEISQFVLNTYCGCVEHRPNARGGEFMPGAFSVSINVMCGDHCAATPDGRRDHEPVSDCLGAVHTEIASHDVCGPTAISRSLSKLDQSRIGNGVILNWKFSPTSISGETGRDNLISLMDVYLNNGGMQSQFNIISRETLEDAKENPDEYRDLVVRVAGYSAYFTELNPELQIDLINRTELSFD